MGDGWGVRVGTWRYLSWVGGKGERYALRWMVQVSVSVSVSLQVGSVDL